ncbi:MAG TPA: 50S ribosomal protein L29 [Candidatus Aenigmarchaeota archaeon]|nr:50S ribosomal protein L29 [Candidatus Aenigmarchaeota archaeon]
MAILRSKEIRKMTEEEINKKLNELRLELAKKRAQVIIGGAPENAGKIREIRKTIARILTIKKERS